MIRHTETPEIIGDVQPTYSAEVVAATPEARKIPVAYEEVTLTEEAALIVEEARRAMARQPAREVRRMQVGDPSKFRR